MPQPRYDGIPATLTRDGKAIPPLQPTATGMGDPLPAEDVTMYALLMGNYAAPGRAGVTVVTPLSQRTIYFSDLFRLGEKYGSIEFALTREVEPNGRNVYRLYSGDRSGVSVPNTIYDPICPGLVLRRLGHNHPSRIPYPSRAPLGGDIPNINNDYLNMLMRDPAAPQPYSRIIWGAGDYSITLYFPDVLR